MSTQRKFSKAIDNAYCKFEETINDKTTVIEDEVSIRIFKNGHIDIYINPVDDERYDGFNPCTLTLEELHMIPDAIKLIRKVKKQ